MPTTFSDGESAGGVINTLRDAVIAANNDTGKATDTVQLSAGAYTLSIVNTANNHDVSSTQGDLNITNTNHLLVIQGTTDANGKPTTIIDQTVAERVFQILLRCVGVLGPRQRRRCHALLLKDDDRFNTGFGQ